MTILMTICDNINTFVSHAHDIIDNIFQDNNCMVGIPQESVNVGLLDGVHGVVNGHNA